MTIDKETKAVFAGLFTIAFIMGVVLISACNAAPSRSREFDTVVQTLHILTDRLILIEKKLDITPDPDHVITFGGPVK